MYGIFDENKEEFSERWEKVNKIIKEIENNLLSWIERTSSVKNNSLSVQEKFNNYIYSIFPTLNNVWVKKRVLTKEEMAEYIKNMSKK
jgi:glutaredoxin 2